MPIPRDVRDYYESGREVGRLADGSLAGPLEYARTIELLQRLVPGQRCRILDVGGGPGAYATWLAGLGHSVQLIDPVRRHVDLAGAAGIDAVLGDAEHLPHPDGSVDIVLLMGPLYHLIDAADRKCALREAHRVLRAGGLIVATAISRFAALLDQLIRRDGLRDADELARVENIVETGVLPAREGAVFTTAFMHLPRQLVEELQSAGFDDVSVFGIEGPGYLVRDFDERWADDSRRTALVRAAQLVESDPELLALGGHLLAHGRMPSA